MYRFIMMKIFSDFLLCCYEKKSIIHFDEQKRDRKGNCRAARYA